MNRRLAVVPVLAAAVFGLVACTSNTPGSATGTTGGGQTTTTAPDTTTSSGGSNGSPLAALQPCSLVSSSVQSQLQVSQSQSGTDSGARYCDWQRPVDQNGDNGYVLGVGLRDHQGLGDVKSTGYTVTSDPIGAHQGKQLQSTNSGDCIIAIGVSSTSRVDVTAAAGSDANLACQLANQLAKAVEPQLPAGG